MFEKDRRRMKCWIVTEGLAGTENQCLGVAESLGLSPEIKRIGLRQPWKAFSPFLGLECPGTFTGDALSPPWPDLVIASGRKAVAAARYIKRRSHGSAFTVFLQDPKTDPASFDLVAVPAHDGLRDPNVLVTSAAPNRLTSARLDGAREEWRPVFEKMNNPRIAVLVGGSSKAYAMDWQAVQNIADAVKKLEDRHCSVMLTMSRRTGAGNERLLRENLKDCNAWIWDGEEVNPYFGMLAWADAVLVTADSVSMISEAATIGKPVYILPMPGGNAKLDRFHRNLIDRGIVRMFEGDPEYYQYEPLNDAKLVAEAIRKAMNLPMAAK